MNRNIFCTYVISPVSAIMPREKELPQTAPVAVDAFESQKEAALFAKEVANKRSAKATDTLAGPWHTRCLIPGVALTYQVSVDDADYAKFQSDRAKGPVKMFINDMTIKTMNAHLYEDVLHPAADLTMDKLSEEMTNRWYNYRQVEKALSTSSSEMLAPLDFTDAATRDNLREVYGHNGLINKGFAVEQDFEATLRSIEKTMMGGENGIAYSLVVKEVEKQYRETYHQAIYNGDSEQIAIANAGLAACEVLRTQANKYKDEAIVANYLDPTVAELQVEAGAVEPAVEDSER